MPSAPQPEQRAYMRLAASIRDQIVGGELPGGSALPTMNDLRRKNRHSRQTVGKALHILETEGLIYRVAGLGYFASVQDQTP
jgi:DNA-binding GntR family transcriptional regulator